MLEKLSENFSGYLEYFENLRRRLFSIAVTFFIFFMAGFFGAGHIMRFIVNIFNLNSATIVTTSPFQFLGLATNIGLYTGIIFSIPIFLYHAYDFLKDGLNRNEKKLFFILLPVGFVLFIFGFSYCFTILYFYLNTASAINVSFGLQNVWDISSFMSQVILASVVLGLVFQFPIVLTFLIRVGLLDVNTLKKKRFIAYSVIFIFVGFLPPPDIFSTIVQAAPLILIYQVTLWVNSAYMKRASYIVKTSRPATQLTT